MAWLAHGGNHLIADAKRARLPLNGRDVRHQYVNFPIQYAGECLLRCVVHTNCIRDRRVEEDRIGRVTVSANLILLSQRW